MLSVVSRDTLSQLKSGVRPGIGIANANSLMKLIYKKRANEFLGVVDELPDSMNSTQHAITLRP